MRTRQPARQSSLPTRSHEPEPASAAHSSAVHWWALVGGGAVLLQMYIYGAWFASGELNPVATGKDPVPTYMQTLAWVLQAGGLALVAALVWKCLIQPWRRNGYPTLDGLIIIGVFAMYWQDPIPNWVQWQFSYNATLLNLGSWAPHIPGFNAPNGHDWAEPPFLVVPVYIIFIFGGSALGTWIMRATAKRFPALGTMRLALVAYLILLLLECAVEVPFLLTGVWTFDTALPGMALFHGHYFQFPFYEAFTVALVVVVLSVVRYSVDDHGESPVERGARNARSDSRRTILRALAVIGLCNVLWFSFTNLPYAGFAVHGVFNPGSDKSFYRQGMCGQGTSYACPGPAVPIPRKDSVHISPDGSVMGVDQPPADRP